MEHYICKKRAYKETVESFYTVSNPTSTNYYNYNTFYGIYDSGLNKAASITYNRIHYSFNEGVICFGSKDENGIWTLTECYSGLTQQIPDEDFKEHFEQFNIELDDYTSYLVETKKQKGDVIEIIPAFKNLDMFIYKVIMIVTSKDKTYYNDVRLGTNIKEMIEQGYKNLRSKNARRIIDSDYKKHAFIPSFL